MRGLLENPALWAALLAAIPAMVAGVLLDRRSRRNDAVAEQAGIATAQHTSIGQVVDGLDRLVENLQEDNRALREHVKELNVKLDRIIGECQELKRQLVILSQASA